MNLDPEEFDVLAVKVITKLRKEADEKIIALIDNSMKNISNNPQVILYITQLLDEKFDRFKDTVRQLIREELKIQAKE